MDVVFLMIFAILGRSLCPTMGAGPTVCYNFYDHCDESEISVDNSSSVFLKMSGSNPAGDRTCMLSFEAKTGHTFYYKFTVFEMPTDNVTVWTLYAPADWKDYKELEEFNKVSKPSLGHVYRIFGYRLFRIYVQRFNSDKSDYHLTMIISNHKDFPGKIGKDCPAIESIKKIWPWWSIMLLVFFIGITIFSFATHFYIRNRKRVKQACCCCEMPKRVTHSEGATATLPTREHNARGPTAPTSSSVLSRNHSYTSSGNKRPSKTNAYNNDGFHMDPNRLAHPPMPCEGSTSGTMYSTSMGNNSNSSTLGGQNPFPPTAPEMACISARVDYNPTIYVPTLRTTNYPTSAEYNPRDPPPSYDSVVQNSSLAFPPVLPTGYSPVGPLVASAPILPNGT